jgi:hypothetical protein
LLLQQIVKVVEIQLLNELFRLKIDIFILYLG